LTTSFSFDKENATDVLSLDNKIIAADINVTLNPIIEELDMPLPTIYAKNSTSIYVENTTDVLA
jgi:hypothetical protein